MLWGFWITVVAIVMPLFILPFVIPSFLASQGGGGGGGGGGGARGSKYRALRGACVVDKTIV